MMVPLLLKENLKINDAREIMLYRQPAVAPLPLFLIFWNVVLICSLRYR